MAQTKKQRIYNHLRNMSKLSESQKKATGIFNNPYEGIVYESEHHYWITNKVVLARINKSVVDFDGFETIIDEDVTRAFSEYLEYSLKCQSFPVMKINPTLGNEVLKLFELLGKYPTLTFNSGNELKQFVVALAPDIVVIIAGVL